MKKFLKWLKRLPRNVLRMVTALLKAIGITIPILAFGVMLYRIFATDDPSLAIAWAASFLIMCGGIVLLAVGAAAGYRIIARINRDIETG